jgi:SNF2 family DNA or RNA helicase
MSGTPIANRPYDLWSQIWFLDHGESLGNDFKTFKATLDLPQAHTGRRGRALFAQELTGLFEKIQRFTVRETKASSGIVLPTKEIENIPVSFEPAQERLYRKFRDETAAEILKDSEMVVDDAEAILKRLLRLVQVASNPKLVDDSYEGTPAKLPVLAGLIEKITNARAKAIVWTSFTENADWLSREMERFGAVKVHGKMAIADRNASIARFKQDPEHKILVATPGAAKEGLTLTVANYAIFYDRSFSLDDYLQAQDRIHRITQHSACFIYNLIMRDSIDEWVNELLSAKHIAAKLGQGDIDKRSFEKQMSYEFSTMLAAILNLRH